MEFLKATQEDLAYVRQNPFEGAVKDYPYMEIPGDNCYLGIHNSAILGVFGVQVRWEGVGQFWLMMAKDFKEHISGTRALLIISRKVDELIRKNNLWRAEAMVRTDFMVAIEMMGFLGFEREGLMKKYFPDKTDAILYAKVI